MSSHSEMPPYPSIQSFYNREIPEPIEIQDSPSPAKQGDGFTEKELASSLDPWTRQWNPEREYIESTIINLVPGPKCVTFVGRIVNFSTIIGHSQKQPKASGWHYLIVKDNSAAISIKLYFSQNPYPFKFSQVLSIWTAFISDTSKAECTTISSVLVYANLFPGRNTSDHIMIHSSPGVETLCRTPLDYHPHQQLTGLMVLDAYLNGGHDGVPGARILVCVKSIGAKKRITKKTGGESTLAEVIIFDNTAETKLKLWGEAIESTKEWMPRKTLLLITNPGYRLEYNGKGSLGITPTSMVDVDPEMTDAEWLRKFVKSMTRKESLCIEFPEGVWDVEGAEYGIYRTLFTLRDVDEWVRRAPHRKFTGFLSITITSLSLISNYRRNMLFCTTHCGVDQYSNTISLSCQNCSEALTLSLNPKNIGMLVDESGCIAAGKLLWSERAWAQLFGRDFQDVPQMSIEQIQLLEQRVLWMRWHLLFGWEEEVGRLAVLGLKA